MIALQATLVAMLTLLITGGTAGQDAEPPPDGESVTVEVTDIAPPVANPDALQPVSPFVPIQPDPPDVGAPAILWQPHVTQIAEPFIIALTNPVNDGEIIEGESMQLTWHTGGPIAQVRMSYEFEKCRLGGRSNGKVGRLIGGGMLPNTGSYTWTVPWLDTHQLRLRIAGYDAEGGLIDAEEIGLQYRPRQLRDLPPTAIGIIKSRQRLYYLEDGKILRMHIVSTAAGGYWTPLMQPGSTDRRRGRMGQVFYKDANAWSRLYDCWMPHWMAITSSGSHGIHATSRGFYHRLGRPASHGCVRQHRADARKLYQLVKVGTPVYVRD